MELDREDCIKTPPGPSPVAGVGYKPILQLESIHGWKTEVEVDRHPRHSRCHGEQALRRNRIFDDAHENYVANRYGVINEQTGDRPDIFVCSSRCQPWPEFWDTFRYYG